MLNDSKDKESNPSDGSSGKDKDNNLGMITVENATLNLNNGNDITMVDHVLPTTNEYDMLYNFYNYDVDYDDGMNVGMQEDDIAFDNDFELDHDRMRGDNEVNDSFEVPISANCDAHFVSVGFKMDSFLIPSTGDDSVPIPPIHNEIIYKQQE
ncbi:hypothetical protein FNV43_RR02378 [Rhamnella rubrinervis]|uniref:Uncharacterized protein n=1 Tax=Rhamnella rubrinervis TaxID=2594499 RepID=A0A8K0HS53_9ROSA|nr:hypothetical protein FNV43_RR02378 [Rhamnella rubrinervis]